MPAAALNVAIPGETLADVLPRLRSTYCGSIAYQIEHLSSHRQRTWLRQVIESGAFEATPVPEEQRRLLIRLLRVELFEQYIRRTFLGEKQLLDRGHRHDDPDARRDDRDRRRAGARRRSCSAWPTAAG